VDLPEYLPYLFYEESKVNIRDTFVPTVFGIIVFCIVYMGLEMYTAYETKTNNKETKTNN